MNTKPITAGATGASSPGGRAKPASPAAEKKIQLVRNLIWLYIILWIGEGALRRWFLPGLASPLLLIRDPLVIAIYFAAAAANVFPGNAFITGGALLASLSFLNAMLLGHGNGFVAFYGVRCDFLHVPLIFVMGKVLRQKDLMLLMKCALWISVPYTMLLVAQYYQPQDAWVNRGVGGDMAGAGFDGALDHFRPPGTFSFITGPTQLYPFFTACLFGLLMLKKLPVWLMIASGAAILVAVPISISRTLFLNVVVVAAAGIGAMVFSGRGSMKIMLQFVVAAGVLFLLAGQSEVFKDGMKTFGARWETATTDNGGFKEAIVDRMMEDLFGYLGGVKGYGKGTGFSTNVGQKSLTSELGFGGSEGEWGRLLYDNGFMLGSMLIAYRASLALWVAFVSLAAWKRRSTISFVFLAACFQIIVHGHWGQTTTLGSTVIGAGLVVATAYNLGKKEPVKSLALQPVRQPQFA